MRRVVVRAALVTSLVAAVLGGAAVATELRPTSHIAAAHSNALGAPVKRSAPVATPSPTPLPPAPSARAILTAPDGKAIGDGTWIRERAVSIRVSLAASAMTSLAAEAEVVPVEVPFSGIPTIRGPLVPLPALQTAETTLAVSHLTDGQRYRWRVRTRTADGRLGEWSDAGLFGVSQARPLSPQLATTSVKLAAWGRQTDAVFRWTDAGSRLPIGYFEYAVVHASHPALSGAVWTVARGSILSLTGLTQGYWHIYVRAVDLAGNRSIPAHWPFSIGLTPPPAPRFTATVPANGAWSNASTPRAQWSATTGAAPLAGFEYALSYAGSSDPPSWTAQGGSALELPSLADGYWRVLVRSVDAAGNRSDPAVWSFHIDRESLLVSTPLLSLQSFTPPVERLKTRFHLSKDAAVTFRITPVGAGTPIAIGSLGWQTATHPLTVTWTGMLAPRTPAPAGDYTLSIDAVDRAGNASHVVSAPFTVLDKRIVVSLSKEALWAYQGGHLFLTTLVTNGGPDTPTVPGIFHVQGKYRGWVFHSPWPKGSPFWYADSPTSFALLYEQQGGYFLHDAPWRSNFGPGSNSLAGSPGGSYTGTHGCTNVPYDMMQKIFDWADNGTLVQIVK